MWMGWFPGITSPLSNVSSVVPGLDREEELAIRAGLQAEVFKFCLSHSESILHNKFAEENSFIALLEFGIQSE